MVPLGEVVTAVTRSDPARSPGEMFRYVDLSAVDQAAKSITDHKLILGSEAPSRARQVLRMDDILVSTVRPNLNGVARVPKHLEGSIGSTGFCVMRPNPHELNGSYAFHWVRSKKFIDEMVRKASGASYPAVSDNLVLSSKVPLPDLDEQRRIAAILDKADDLRAKRREALVHLDTLTQSIFHDMFGSHAEFPLLTVSDLVASTKGAIRTGPFGSQLLTSEFTTAGIAVLGIDNAVDNKFSWKQRRYISLEKYRELSRYTVCPGDLIVTIMGTLGRCAVIPDDIPLAINTKHLCCITLDQSKCLPEFLHSYFLLHPTAKQFLGQTTKGSIMGGLNMGIIKNLPVKLPPLHLQQEFATRVAAVERLKDQHRTQLAALDSLFASLQHRAFGGEL
ncbi:restriction endonuclease subunit S [Arthrobacter sp. H5]|uniref:restriction endonuclease subunit S n=1 Tax=Arthrobacter sp. H5 TaxID=1267973 RepID=UPI0005616D09